MDEAEFARRINADAAGIGKDHKADEVVNLDYQERLKIAARLQSSNFANNSRHYTRLRQRLLSSAMQKLPAKVKKGAFSQKMAALGLAAGLIVLVIGLALGINRLVPGMASNHSAGAGVTPQPTVTPVPVISDPTQTNQINSTATMRPSPSQTAAFSDNKAVVKFFLTYQPEEYAALSTLAELFNAAHTDIQVILSNVWPADHFAVAMASQYDCFIFQHDPITLGQSGLFLDMNDFLQKEPPTLVKDYDPGLLAAYHNQGVLVDLPFTTQPVLMSYNADLLARRGLPAPSNDWTLADFVRLVQGAASAAPDDISYGFLGGQDININEFLLASRKVPTWIDNSTGLPSVNFNTPEMADAMAWIAKMYQSKALYRDTTTDWWLQMSTTFGAGQVAFWDSRAGETDGSMVYMSGKATFKTGAVLLPTLPAGTHLDYRQSYDRGFYISRQAKNSQACWTWIKFLTEHPEAFHGLPARLSMAASPAWESSVGAQTAALYRSAEARINRQPVTAKSSNLAYIQFPLQQWLWLAMNTSFTGGDIQAALVNAQQKAEVYLSCTQAIDLAKTNTNEIKDQLTPCVKQADPQETWWQ